MPKCGLPTRGEWKLGWKLAFAAGIAALPLTAGLASPGASDEINAGSLPLVREIDERFQSFQLGMSHLTGGDTWRSYDSLPADKQVRQYGGDLAVIREPRAATDLQNRKLRTLAAALGPFYVRYGGTTSNTVFFQDNDAPQLAKAPPGYTVVLTRKRWRQALEFAKAVDAKVVTGFSVGAGVRDAADTWTPVHAKPWLEYTRSIGGEIYAAEMYNEPNMAMINKRHAGYDANAFARDFAVFRPFVAKAAPKIRIAGPGDVLTGTYTERMPGTPAPEEYMTAGPRPRFDIMSYHYYGGLAERCAPASSPQGISPEKALSEEWLARHDKPLQNRIALRDRYAPGAPIWNTESGGAACGGTRWQTSFLETFRYLDNHGRMAKQGLDAIFTHALISGSNGVIDEKTFDPSPVYWASLLWRRLMGTRVLDAGPLRPGLHLYAHCQRGTKGGVTLLALNLQPGTASVGVTGPAQVYALTAPELQSKTVLLNGRPLALGAGDTLPELRPVAVEEGRISLAPTSVNFITLPGAANPACKG